MCESVKTSAVVPTPYRRLPGLFELIEPVQREVCQKIHDDNLELFRAVKGSSRKHHAWQGGYLDHVSEVMNLAVVLYGPLNGCRSLPFSLSEALVVLFLHDLEKAWKYRLDDQGRPVDEPALATKAARRTFREAKLAEYGLELSAEQQNAMRYVEGELDDYGPERVQGPLAAFCHACDNLSARLWHDRPHRPFDEWTGGGVALSRIHCILLAAGASGLTDRELASRYFREFGRVDYQDVEGAIESSYQRKLIFAQERDTRRWIAREFSRQSDKPTR